jgi:hypothetical protein
MKKQGEISPTMGWKFSPFRAVSPVESVCFCAECAVKVTKGCLLFSFCKIFAGDGKIKKPLLRRGRRALAVGS